MAILSLNASAKFIRKSKSDILRAIENGSLSAYRDPINKKNWQIDTSELLRRFGSPKTSEEPVLKPLEPPKNQSELDVVWLMEQINFLQRELVEQKKEFIERERRIIALLEHNKGSVEVTAPAKSRQNNDLWRKVFKKSFI